MIIPTNSRPVKAPTAALEMLRKQHGLKTLRQAEKLIQKTYGGFLFEALMFWLMDGQPMICKRIIKIKGIIE